MSKELIHVKFGEMGFVEETVTASSTKPISPNFSFVCFLVLYHRIASRLWSTAKVRYYNVGTDENSPKYSY